MKLTRYDGHVPLFSQDMQGRERTLFGSIVQDDDINNQFTPEFLRGWGSVGSTEFPTLQDFNALAYTHNKLLSYLYQAGIPSYSRNEEYYIGSIVQYNKDIYICLRDKPTVLPTDTNAWKRVQESLTFIGDGHEVMKKGAFGLGSFSSKSIDVNNLSSERSCFTSSFGYLSSMPSGSKAGVLLKRGSNISQLLYATISNEWYGTTKWGDKSDVTVQFISTGNTRTDKNNVLHAGASTPINTLNVSDMSQEVINNDLLTVTSGAVYRALQPKADLTYVNAELNKKANLTYVNTELDKKITGGNVVQTTGQSTVDVMSQKAVTDVMGGLLKSPRNVKNERVLETTYTNTTDGILIVTVSCAYSGGAERYPVNVKIDGVEIITGLGTRIQTFQYVITAFVPPKSKYSVHCTGANFSSWVEQAI